ncbi:MAG TPA: hypothetical protein VFV33_09800 [Gemmatimonadaceae bacterium]|nr:hypothetical protein [Gemmatimonadaceae bacterium]
MPIPSPLALTAVRVVHTVAWAFFASAIVAMPVATWFRRFDLFCLFAGIVAVEVAVLALNRMRCPLTDVAARFTDDRRDNFDIYLPLTLARYNKQVFGTLYVLALLHGALAWMG